MGRQQPSKDANVGLKDLRFGVDIEGDPLNNLANCILEARAVVEYHQGVQRVYQREREIARNVIVRDVLA